MDFAEVIKKRASVRTYTSEPIDKKILEDIVDAGRRAPTARAVEPWEFVIVQDRKTLTAIAECAPNGRFIKDAKAAIILFCTQTKYYLEDGVAATQNMLLSACAHEIGACWIAGDKKDYAPDIARMLQMPANMNLISILSLGKPAEPVEQIKKRTLRDVMHWEKF